MIGVCLCGACGRMGRVLVRRISEQGDMRLVAAVEAPSSPFLGKDAGEVAGVGGGGGGGGWWCGGPGSWRRS